MMDKNMKFDDIFEACLQSVLTGSETIEQCLQRYPEQASELEPLLRTAMSVTRAADIAPSPEFKKRAHLQMQLKISESKPRRLSFFSLQPRWALAGVAAMVVFLLGTGTVMAANGSMPGNPLYPVKLATENVRVAVAGSDVEKAALYATYADRRMTEMTNMAETGNTQNIETVAKRFNTDVSNMTKVPLAKNTSNESQTMTVQSINPAVAPAPVSPPMMTSTPKTMMGGAGSINSPVPTTPTASTGKAATGFGTAPGSNHRPGAADTTATPIVSAEQSNTANMNIAAKNSSQTDKLKSAIAYYAKMHPAELQKLLDSNKVPESAKPAIRRALYISQQGYKKALQDLNK